MKALVLDAGNTASYHVMRSLAMRGHNVHLAAARDCVFFESRYCSAAHHAPSPDDGPRYLHFLTDVLASRDFGVLFFCSDHQARLVWQHREKLQPMVECLIPSGRHQAVVFSKLAASGHVRQLGIAIPRTRRLDSLDCLPAVVAGLRFPIVIKTEKGSTHRGVRVARSLAEAEACARQFSAPALDPHRHLCVQEFIPGPSYVAHVLMAHGQPMALCAHRKDRELPADGGVTSAATTVRIPELEEAALQIVASLDWHGLAKLDFKRDQRDGALTFIGLDARVSASIDITRAAGCDQIAMASELAQGRTPAPQLNFQEGVRYRWLVREVQALLNEPGRVSVADFLSPGAHWDLSPQDRHPLLGSLRGLASHLKGRIGRRAMTGTAR
jgi:predicted ATP-grasp superfamily ATP-dependent carboligase